MVARRGPPSTTRWTEKGTPSRSTGDGADLGPAADGEEGGVRAVPPVVPADGRGLLERTPVQGAPQAGGPGHGARPGRRPGPPAASRPASGPWARRRSRPGAPRESASAMALVTPSIGDRVRPVTRARRPAKPRARRAVRADQANGVGGAGLLRRPERVRTWWSVRRNDAPPGSRRRPGRPASAGSVAPPRAPSRRRRARRRRAAPTGPRVRTGGPGTSGIGLAGRPTASGIAGPSVDSRTTTWDTIVRRCSSSTSSTP